MTTVWVYVDTSKEVGDRDHLKVFATPDAADEWFTVRAEDLAVWEQFPNAAFTLVTTAAATDVVGVEFRLGTFEL